MPRGCQKGRPSPAAFRREPITFLASSRAVGAAGAREASTRESVARRGGWRPTGTLPERHAPAPAARETMPVAMALGRHLPVPAGRPGAAIDRVIRDHG